jgi:hypothetical protein
MSAKPRTRPKDLVLSVRLARWPGANARGLPRTVPTVRIPLGFSATSRTCWRCREAGANLSLTAGRPISLLNREKTGNFREFSRFGGNITGINSLNQ